MVLIIDNGLDGIRELITDARDCSKANLDRKTNKSHEYLRLTGEVGMANTLLAYLGNAVLTEKPDGKRKLGDLSATDRRIIAETIANGWGGCGEHTNPTVGELRDLIDDACQEIAAERAKMTPAQDWADRARAGVATIEEFPPKPVFAGGGLAAKLAESSINALELAAQFSQLALTAAAQEAHPLMEVSAPHGPMDGELRREADTGQLFVYRDMLWRELVERSDVDGIPTKAYVDHVAQPVDPRWRVLSNNVVAIWEALKLVYAHTPPGHSVHASIDATVRHVIDCLKSDGAELAEREAEYLKAVWIGHNPATRLEIRSRILSENAADIWEALKDLEVAFRVSQPGSLGRAALERKADDVLRRVVMELVQNAAQSTAGEGRYL